MKHDKKPRTTSQERPAVLPLEVKFLFNGLFFFSFSPITERPPYDLREKCTVGILSTRRGGNKDHSLFVRFGQEGHLSDPIEIPHSALTRLEEIEITRTGLSSPRDVTIRGFDGPPPGWRAPQDRNDRDNDPDFFNWIIDFEALHHQDLIETPGSLRPKLQFKTGDFYTHKISENKYTIQQGDTPARRFGHVAAIIGAKMVLDDTEQIVLTVNGVPNPLPRNITEIHLHNVRPEDLPAILSMDGGEGQRSGGDSHKHADQSSPAHEHHDDSQIYYYDLLQGVPPTERFHFKPFDPKRSEPFVCYGTGGSLP
jgi:hypothetical protein